ncbi:NifB/NifX family molybdenum-iron cluster-binding protein [Arcobacter sp. FWKO B]|uniref:NifB/NifX family molybdenum-iron cluster-binding protein n=1 Tax=Arcobacter sp. FWKO B TaxID=2593672 RepID=UPI0018A466B0|nr:NifB/NifX family molybdenum-iron cluster-binding protein [Arcobacter sp. FWKO B]QOG11206.1 dinitrogenase [Arcobacter sp. FWKO B]
MIAIPVKIQKDDIVVAHSFGRAIYFAIANKGQIEIVKNNYHCGRSVAVWLKSLGVTDIIVSQLKKNPFEALQNIGIKVYYIGKKKVGFRNAILKFADGEVPILNQFSYELYMKKSPLNDEQSVVQTYKERIHSLIEQRVVSNVVKTYQL